MTGARRGEERGKEKASWGVESQLVILGWEGQNGAIRENVVSGLQAAYGSQYENV